MPGGPGRDKYFRLVARCHQTPLDRTAPHWTAPTIPTKRCAESRSGSLSGSPPPLLPWNDYEPIDEGDGRRRSNGPESSPFDAGTGAWRRFDTQWFVDRTGRDPTSETAANRTVPATVSRGSVTEGGLVSPFGPIRRLCVANEWLRDARGSVRGDIRDCQTRHEPCLGGLSDPREVLGVVVVGQVDQTFDIEDAVGCVGPGACPAGVIQGGQGRDRLGADHFERVEDLRE